MKICYVVETVNQCFGWGRLVREIGERLGKEGSEIGSVVEQGEGMGGERLVLPLHVLRFSQFFLFLRTALTLRRFFKKFDIIHAVDMSPNGILAFFALMGLKKKLVVTANATYSLFGRNPLKNFMMRLAYKRADMVAVASEFTKRHIEKGGFRIPRARIIPPGVDVEKFIPRSSTRPLNVKKPFILGVGALKERKGYHVSIEAFSKIKDEYPELSYVIVGEPGKGEYFSYLQRLVENYGLNGRVFFFSGLTDDDLVEYYNQSEFFLLTPITTEAHMEGFGMVYVEAGACKKAVIGFSNTGAEAPIINGYNGILVPYNDMNALVGAIKRLLRDPEEARIMGENGRMRAEEFRWEKIVSLYLGVYKNL